MASSSSSGVLAVGQARHENVRMRRFDEALDKFLELLDERATTNNFTTALPHLDPKLLESARKQFVFHLKDAIKMEKDRLAESYQLGERLAELEELTREADARNEQARRQGTTAAALHRDAWRPTIDLSTALSAPVVPLYKERIAVLQAELEALEEDNGREQARLRSSIAAESEKREDAKRALDLLDDTVRGLEFDEDERTRIRTTLDRLLGEMGARGIA